MQYRNLGRAGVNVSAIGIGCNQFGGKMDEGGTVMYEYDLTRR